LTLTDGLAAQINLLIFDTSPFSVRNRENRSLSFGRDRPKASEVKILGFVRLPLIHRASGEPASTFVEATAKFDEIRQALISRFCFSGVSQSPGPFAASFTVCAPRISRAENHDAKWLRPHTRRIGLKTKSHLRILQRALKLLPSPNNIKHRL
jgi:hypothetical protein